jgi:simple sugar transport system permease protein
MKRKSFSLAFLGKIEGLPIAAVLATLYVVFIITAPQVFSGYRIYMSFLQTIPPMLVLALGLTFVITAGEIDLSFSAVVAFAGFVFSWVFKTFGAPWAVWAGLVLALAAGALVGYVNGLLVAKVGVPSIMATLAAQFFWSGLTVLLAGGLSWNIKEIQTNIVHTIFVGRLFGIVPAQALWALGLAVFLWLILNRHKFGEAIMFIGDNPNVARVMGINVEATRIQLFTMNGVIAAFAALLLTTEMHTFWTTQGEGYLLPAMAAVFIGGTSIAGGEGSIVGSFFGAYIIGSLEAGVVATGIGGYWTRLVSGLVMAASVVLNVVIGEGRFAMLSNRIRHWVVPVHSNTTGEVSKKDDVALK